MFPLAMLESFTKFYRLVENSMIGICSVATSTTRPSEKELSFDTLSVASGRCRRVLFCSFRTCQNKKTRHARFSRFLGVAPNKNGGEFEDPTTRQWIHSND
jgi:hypothetical protein